MDKKVPSDDVQRDPTGETWMGMRVAAWEWVVSSPLGELPHHATHWSTGPKNADRLYRESDIRALLARYGAQPQPSGISGDIDTAIKTAEAFNADIPVTPEEDEEWQRREMK